MKYILYTLGKNNNFNYDVYLESHRKSKKTEIPQVPNAEYRIYIYIYVCVSCVRILYHNNKSMFFMLIIFATLVLVHIFPFSLYSFILFQRPIILCQTVAYVRDVCAHCTRRDRIRGIMCLIWLNCLKTRPREFRRIIISGNSGSGSGGSGILW